MSFKHAMEFVGIRKFLTDKRERSRFVDLCIMSRSVWRSRIARAHPVTALRVAMPAMRYSIGQRHELHLGTEVMYQGEKWYVSNGTRYPSWDIRRCDDRTVTACVDKDELEIVRTPKNMKHNALQLYGWWVESWSSLDIRDVLEGEMPASLRILGSRSPLRYSKWAKEGS